MPFDAGDVRVEQDLVVDQRALTRLGATAAAREVGAPT
jgi:hypothetical protein